MSSEAKRIVVSNDGDKHGSKSRKDIVALTFDKIDEGSMVEEARDEAVGAISTFFGSMPCSLNATLLMQL